MKNLILYFGLLLLTACQANVTVLSRPEGAYITSSNRVVAGIAPVVFTYQIDKQKTPRDSNGCWIVQGATAQWASGASRVYDNFTLCGSESGNFNIVMDRPQEAPNLQADLNYALQLRNQQAAAEQARAARQAAAASAFLSYSAAMQPKATPPPTTQTYIMPSGKMTNCTTTGNVTHCY